ncbi:MAG: cytochrome C, partial [Myxococcales bacterium]|nr:cytochrome C [Myxococcales bacterium]
MCVLLGCATSEPSADVPEAGAQALHRRTTDIVTDAPTTTHTPVGLAIEVENGVGVPVRVRAGQRFWLDQIDLRAMNVTSVDQGIDSLDDTGDFAHLDWRNTELEEFDFIGLPNPDGTFTRRAYYRGAKWMERTNVFALWQVDDRGRLSGLPIVVSAGREQERLPSDDFFIRRLRGIQWTNDCPSKEDCTGATNFMEEALVEVRNSLRPSNTFRMQSSTQAFALWWNQNPTNVYTIPVEQEAAPTYDYGFRMEVEPVTPAGPDGSYAPGTDVTFQITLMDGSGNPLHPDGSLPTYNEVLAGDPGGISYYRAFGFIDPSATYYRRKHRERMLMGQIIGPAQDIQPIYSIASLESFLFEDTQLVGTPAVDGVYSEVQLFPPAPIVFGGAFTPGNPQWNDPVSDTMTFHIPADATPGTYLVTLKGRRVYLGQDIPRTVTIEIQV